MFCQTIFLLADCRLSLSFPFLYLSDWWTVPTKWEKIYCGHAAASEFYMWEYNCDTISSLCLHIFQGHGGMFDLLCIIYTLCLHFDTISTYSSLVLLFYVPWIVLFSLILWTNIIIDKCYCRGIYFCSWLNKSVNMFILLVSWSQNTIL